MDEEELQQIADETAEAVPALRKFFSLGREDQIKVAAILFDRMIGTDDTAQIRSLPMMSSEMLESITDMLAPLMAAGLVKLLVGDQE